MHLRCRHPISEWNAIISKEHQLICSTIPFQRSTLLQLSTLLPPGDQITVMCSTWGLYIETIWKLEPVQNGSTHSFSKAPCRRHHQHTVIITKLPINFWLEFAMLVLTHKALNGLGPGNMRDVLSPCTYCCSYDQQPTCNLNGIGYCWQDIWGFGTPWSAWAIIC